MTVDPDYSVWSLQDGKALLEPYRSLLEARSAMERTDGPAIVVCRGKIWAMTEHSAEDLSPLANAAGIPADALLRVIKVRGGGRLDDYQRCAWKGCSHVRSARPSARAELTGLCRFHRANAAKFGYVRLDDGTVVHLPGAAAAPPGHARKNRKKTSTGKAAWPATSLLPEASAVRPEDTRPVVTPQEAITAVRLVLDLADRLGVALRTIGEAVALKDCIEQSGAGASVTANSHAEDVYYLVRRLGWSPEEAFGLAADRARQVVELARKHEAERLTT